MVIHYVISHSNGASIIIGLVIAHIHRGLYINSHLYNQSSMDIRFSLIYVINGNKLSRISISIGAYVVSGEVQLQLQ